MKYTLKRSRRAKYMRLSVQAGGTVILTVPHRMPQNVIGKFLTEHTDWIEKVAQKMSRYKRLPISGRRGYLKYKERARAFVSESVHYWNQYYKFPYGRIAIKNTRRIWGSCSRKGNLNFSYALLFLPRELADYIVVHELCHLKEHNHSERFWSLVAQAVPNSRTLRRELKTYIVR